MPMIQIQTIFHYHSTIHDTLIHYFTKATPINPIANWEKNQQMKANDDGIFIEVYENLFSEKKTMFADIKKQHKYPGDHIR